MVTFGKNVGDIGDVGSTLPETNSNKKRPRTLRGGGESSHLLRHSPTVGELYLSEPGQVAGGGILFGIKWTLISNLFHRAIGCS